MINSETRELHPLEPFLPDGTKLLMLGSFPPPRKRWSMDFYYPNLQNDMWRIFGLVFFNDKDHFLLGEVAGTKPRFDKNKLVSFLNMKKIGLSDTAVAIIRETGSAADKHLHILESLDINKTLTELKVCQAVVTTGEKAANTLAESTGTIVPSVGKYITFEVCGRSMRHYRMPSSSRAYPLALTKKADFYRNMFLEEGFI